MRIVSIDLETIANEAMSTLLPEPRPHGSIKDPEKKAADIAKKREKQIEEMALDPRFNQIIHASFFDNSGNYQALSLWYADRYVDLLEHIHRTLSNYDMVVTFNGNSFDIPTLSLQSLLHGVRPTVHLGTSRYRIDNHLDVRNWMMNQLGKWDGNLDFWAKWFGMEGKTSSGSQVGGWYQAGKYQLIEEHARNDVRLTLEIGLKILDFEGIWADMENEEPARRCNVQQAEHE